MTAKTLGCTWSVPRTALSLKPPPYHGPTVSLGGEALQVATTAINKASGTPKAAAKAAVKAKSKAKAKALA